jgi:hypothetical protein
MAGQTADIYSKAHTDGLQSQALAIGQLANMQNAATQPAALQEAVGASERGYEQAMLGENMQRWMFEQQRPWDLLSMYQGAVTGNYGGTTKGSASNKGSSFGISL